MIETIKKIIIDFQEKQFQSGFPRSLKLEFIENKATVLIGVRRSGKRKYRLS